MDLKTQFLTQVVPQLIVALGLALAILITFLKSKLGKAIAESKMSAASQAAVSWASSLAFEIVLAGMQTTADNLKKALADGKITKEEYAAGMADLKKIALEKLQAATLGRLLGSGMPAGQAATLNSDLIEAAVKRVKAETANPPPTAPTA